MAVTKNHSDKELLELGKKLQQFYDMGYVSKKQALLFTFYRGMASGLGGVLGGTIVVAILLWALSVFSQVPIADRIVVALQHILHTSK